MNHTKVMALCALVFLALVLISRSAPLANATITRVQTKSDGCNTCTSFVLTMDSTPTSGNTLILTFSVAGSATTATQTGVTWTVDRYYTNANYPLIWRGVIGSSPSKNITLGTSGGYPIAATVAEYTGILLVDKSAQMSASPWPSGPTTDTGTTVTTSYANELWIGGVIVIAYTAAATQTSPTNSFTMLGGTSYGPYGSSYYRSVALLEKIVSSTGTANTGTTMTSQENSYYIAGIVTYYVSVGPDFTITNSGPMQLVAGSSNATTITITNILSNPIVNLTCTSGLPSGASCSFSPGTGYASYSSVLTISTTTATVGGSYSIAVRGTASSVSYTTIVGLYVFDFALGAVVNVQVYEGQSSTYTNWVTAALSQGPATNVTFSLLSIPSGVSYSFTPSNSAVPCTSTLQVTATDSVAAGSYAITLSVTGGYQTHTRSFALIVIVPTVTLTFTSTTILTSGVTSTTIISTTLSTTTTKTSTIPVGTSTQTLVSYTSTDIPLVLYGMAAFLVLMPTMIVVLITKSVPGLLIGFVSGIVWAIVSGVLPIYALLLLIGLAVVALIFRVRG